MPENDLSLSIDVSGIDPVVEEYEHFPAAIRAVMTVAMEKSLQLVEGQVKIRTPVFQGTLRSGINHQIIRPFPNLVGSVGSPQPYGIVIEKGRKPGSRMPPVAAIKFWLFRKKIVTDLSELESAAWAVAKHIAKEGFSPKGDVGPTGRKMFKEGLEASEPGVKMIFDDHIRRLTKSLSA